MSEWLPQESLQNHMHDYVIHELKRPYENDETQQQQQEQLQHCWKHCVNKVYSTMISLFPLAEFNHVEPKQNLVMGKSGIINCTATGNPAPHLDWTREGGIPQQKRFKILADGSLKISVAQKGDSGTYTCTLTQMRAEGSTKESIKISVTVIGE